MATAKRTRAGARGPRKLRILVISGPNLDRLGRREPEIYGSQTLENLHDALQQIATRHSCRVHCVQSNHEGELVSAVGRASEDGFDGIVINAGAYTHTSIALLDAIRASELPTIEVHLSNPAAREPFRHHSQIAAACIGCVTGLRGNSYGLGLLGLLMHLRGTTLE